MVYRISQPSTVRMVNPTAHEFPRKDFRARPRLMTGLFFLGGACPPSTISLMTDFASGLYHQAVFFWSMYMMYMTILKCGNRPFAHHLVVSHCVWQLSSGSTAANLHFHPSYCVDSETTDINRLRILARAVTIVTGVIS